MARIEHPYVVPLIDFWRDPDSAYLVMRWLRGGTLERRLDDGPLSVEEALVVAKQIGGALAAAHTHGMFIATSRRPISFSTSRAMPS